MPIAQETVAIAALLRRADIRWSDVADRVEERGSAMAAFRELHDRVELTLLEQDPPPLEDELDPIAEEVAAWEQEGMHLISVLDPTYPENLRTVHDRPPVLFVRGQLRPEDARSVAIVGTRDASQRGLDKAGSAARQFVEAGFVVVSGLAAGVDTAAHRGALEAGGRTIAVIGTGLRRSYPKQNAALQQELGKRSAVASQFWPDQPPGKHTFPMRNAVMSGIALATVVIEASHTSGARMQARIALEHGKPVFLLESLLEHEWAQDYSGRPGVHVVATADEAVRCLERLYSYDVALVA
jgi:DNA processing protein